MGQGIGGPDIRFGGKKNLWQRMFANLNKHTKGAVDKTPVQFKPTIRAFSRVGTHVYAIESILHDT